MLAHFVAFDICLLLCPHHCSVIQYSAFPYNAQEPICFTFPRTGDSA
jgi:hypothetical protein